MISSHVQNVSRADNNVYQDITWQSAFFLLSGKQESVPSSITHTDSFSDPKQLWPWKDRGLGVHSALVPIKSLAFVIPALAPSSVSFTGTFSHGLFLFVYVHPPDNRRGLKAQTDSRWSGEANPSTEAPQSLGLPEVGAPQGLQINPLFPSCTDNSRDCWGWRLLNNWQDTQLNAAKAWPQPLGEPADSRPNASTWIYSNPRWEKEGIAFWGGKWKIML